MRMRVSALLVIAILLGAVGGCQKLRYDQTKTLEPFAPYKIEFSAPAYQQKVSVAIAPTAAGVSAYLLKGTDEPAVTSSLEKEKEPPASLLLASRVSTGAAEPYTFEATVPAKTPYVLILVTRKKTEARVTVVGR